MAAGLRISRLLPIPTSQSIREAVSAKGRLLFASTVARRDESGASVWTLLLSLCLPVPASTTERSFRRHFDQSDAPPLRHLERSGAQSKDLFPRR